MADTATKNRTTEEKKADARAVSSSLRSVADKVRPAAKRADTVPSTEDTPSGAPGRERVVWNIFSAEDKLLTQIEAFTASGAVNIAINRGFPEAHHAVFLRYLDDSEQKALPSDAFSREVLTEFKKRTKAIKDSIGKIDANLGKIAFNLHWINARQAYKTEGYDTIVKYAQEAFGYQKSTCYSLISIVDRFARRDDDGVMLEEFDDRVKGFSTSKLSLMVNLTDAEVSALDPGMSVSDIRAHIRSLTTGAVFPSPDDSRDMKEPSLAQGPDAGQTAAPLDDAPARDHKGALPADQSEDADTAGAGSKDIARQVLITCKGKSDFDAKSDKIGTFVLRVLKAHPDALIEVSYTLPDTAGGKG